MNDLQRLPLREAVKFVEGELRALLETPHFRRGRTGSRENLFEEAADLLIMVRQVRQMDPMAFDAWLKRKLERLELRLQAAERKAQA